MMLIGQYGDVAMYQIGKIPPTYSCISATNNKSLRYGPESTTKQKLFRTECSETQVATSLVNANSVLFLRARSPPITLSRPAEHTAAKASFGPRELSQL